MGKIQFVLAGLYATTALASPWSRNQRRGGGGGGHDRDGHGGGGGGWGGKPATDVGSPGGYGTSASETSPWGYGTTSGCEAVTVTETAGKLRCFARTYEWLIMKSQSQHPL